MLCGAVLRSADLKILRVCALKGEGLVPLKDLMRGRISIWWDIPAWEILILNSIQPAGLKDLPRLRKHQEGTAYHTNVEYVDIDENTAYRTPGVREFGLLDIEPARLCGFFTDFSGTHGQCRFIHALTITSLAAW
jgi:ribosome biogenesis GTPase